MLYGIIQDKVYAKILLSGSIAVINLFYTICQLNQKDNYAALNWIAYTCKLQVTFICD